jgi:hypothetical protein
MNLGKVETVRNWGHNKMTQTACFDNISKIEKILGLGNHYRWFIPKYSENAEPSTRFTKKVEPFERESEQQLPFETLMSAFTAPPALRYFHNNQEENIVTDASADVSAEVLSQRDEKVLLRRVADYFINQSPAKCKCDIYGKEVMAFIKALKVRRHDCEGPAYPLHLKTDHKHLKYIMTKQRLNR